jgi:hypothetical protein
MMYYADVPECVTACFGLWDACVPEGSAYLGCVIGLDCSDVPALVNDPTTSACGPSFNAAIAACM